MAPRLTVSMPILLLAYSLISLYHLCTARDASIDTNAFQPAHEQQHILHDNTYDHNHNDTSDPIPFSTRAHWMRHARSALLDLSGTPCPFGAYGTAIVNHTGHDPASLGMLVCVGANQVCQAGNPTLHGEIAAIANCTLLLSQPPHNLSPSEILAAFSQLSLYTTCEACAMCATAIAYSEFAEYVYATSLRRQYELGWRGVNIGSEEVLGRSKVAGRIRIVPGVLGDEMEELIAWQFGDGRCPESCVREQTEGKKEKENEKLGGCVVQT